MSDKPEIDEVTGTETTGHEWDGISELNTPLPRWWLQIFYATIIFSIGYVILYPAIPMVSTASEGLLGYTSRGEVAEDIAEHRAMQSEWTDRLAAVELSEIGGDAQLLQFATTAGKAAFGVNCSQCHGSGAQGFVGYPNLNDDAWIWGGSLEDIHHTIAHGVRNEDSDDARFSEMPAFGDILGKAEIADVTQHVLALGALEHDTAAAARGAVVYADNCSACHGDAGGGDPSVGAPRLNDALWLFGGDEAHISAQIAQPSHGVMPAWGLRLDEATIRALAVYVHSLGGGE